MPRIGTYLARTWNQGDRDLGLALYLRACVDADDRFTLLDVL
jgi:hypothetical protein